MVPSQNTLKTPVFLDNSHCGPNLAPRPLPGLGELVSEHRKKVGPVWEDQAVGDKKSWKPSPQRDSTANYGQGKGSWSRMQELRVLLHGLVPLANHKHLADRCPCL